MLGINSSDAEVIAIFDKDLGHRECKTEYLLDVTLNAQHSAWVEWAGSGTGTSAVQL